MNEVRQYVVLDPTREEFRRQVACAAFSEKPLPVTVREVLDELSSLRRPARTLSFTLELATIHLGDDGHVIAKITETGAMAHIGSDAETITLTTGDMDDESMDHCPVT